MKLRQASSRGAAPCRGTGAARLLALASVGWAVALDPAPAGAPGPGADVSPPAAPGPVSATAFHPGQVWKFKPRPGEENATLTVLFVERTRLGVFLHLRLGGLHARHPDAPDGFADAEVGSGGGLEIPSSSSRLGEAPDLGDNRPGARHPPHRKAPS